MTRDRIDFFESNEKRANTDLVSEMQSLTSSHRLPPSRRG